MASILLGFRRLAPKTKNLVVADGLTGFVFVVYFYTMRAVGGSDELRIAIDKFESQKDKDDKLAPRTGFVFGVYFYTMRAVGSSDELQIAIDKFESQRNKNDA
ncbi:hypothetical protein LguiB_027030 [Lonicera macranthoides]